MGRKLEKRWTLGSTIFYTYFICWLPECIVGSREKVCVSEVVWKVLVVSAHFHFNCYSFRSLYLQEGLYELKTLCVSSLLLRHVFVRARKQNLFVRRRHSIHHIIIVAIIRRKVVRINIAISSAWHIIWVCIMYHFTWCQGTWTNRGFTSNCYLYLRNIGKLNQPHFTFSLYLVIHIRCSTCSNMWEDVCNCNMKRFSM